MEFPKTFTDDLGRSWTVDITVSTLKRLKLLCAFSIDSLVSEPDPKSRDMEKSAQAAVQPLREFLDDGVRFSEVLYAILKPDADKLGLTPEQFDDGFRWPALTAAREAFLQALHDFFPSPPKRMIVRGLMAEMSRMKILTAAGTKRIEEELAKMTPAMVEKLANDSIDEALSRSVTDSLEHAESIPIPARSAS